MKKLTLKTANEGDFFGRGKKLARLADAAKPLPEEFVVSFEDPADLLKLLTTARLEVLRTVQKQPDSITGIAQRLHRDRSAVKRDIDQFASVGLVTIEEQVLAGHGRMKRVKARAGQIKLEAVLS